MSEMSGAKYFSKLDASNGYWQIKVDEQSSRLLTFNTPFGRYRLSVYHSAYSAQVRSFRRKWQKLSKVSKVAQTCKMIS